LVSLDFYYLADKIKSYTQFSLSHLSELKMFLSNLNADIQNVHCAGLLEVQNILLADTGISQQTEAHSFGDHLISESVSVTPSSATEASTVLCSVSL
jgi:hypothetical protein